MITLLFALALLSVDPGQAFDLVYPDQAGLESVQATWQEHMVPFVRSGDKWIVVLGADLESKVGAHALTVSFMFKDGRKEKREEQIEVHEKSFPTTELQVEPKFVDLSPKDLKRATRETEELEAIFSSITSKILWMKPFRVPIANQKGANFGHRRVFNGEPRAPHTGADLRARTGTPIHSTNRGRVVLAKSLFFTGGTVIVDHGLGIYSLYAHLSKIQVRKGKEVERGQVIGLAGATGRVTGPHLHWAVRVQGARVDPFSLVDLAQQEFP